MAENHVILSYFVVILFICRSLLTAGKSKPTTQSSPLNLFSVPIVDQLRVDPESISAASVDYGNIVRESPAAVLNPSSVEDIAALVRFAYGNNSSPARPPFTVSARGRSHSIRGQALARDGVVVEMMSLKDQAVAISRSPTVGYYADVGGGHLWRDVLEETLRHGLAPVSWTDYLYLTVGGTLSNAGISGETFRFGPQISNVYEVDVVTGTGEFLTCSPNKNTELFYAVLGGLGQFGIITRARIALGQAPKRAKWVRMLYSDFSAFTRDQERLILHHGRNQAEALDYLEGMLIMDQGSPNNWRSSFFPVSDYSRIISLVTKHKLIYCLEAVKYYDDRTQDTVDKELKTLFQGLSYVPGFMFEKDVGYVEFLDRVRDGELKLQAEGLWDVPHPWLNLFIPRSRISDFNTGVFRNIILKRNMTTGVVLVYPMNRNKWDDRMSASVPDEDIFYTVGFLQSSGFDDWQEFDLQNKEVLRFCEDAGIQIKQYLPHYNTEDGWMKHFGSKWRTFRKRKAQFDPKFILAPGQRIFNH